MGVCELFRRKQGEKEPNRQIAMKNKIKKLVYIPTFGEEVANSVSHGVMTVLMLLALPFSAVWAFLHNPENPALASVGVSIFVISILLMFLCSTLYHSMAPE